MLHRLGKSCLQAAGFGLAALMTVSAQGADPVQRGKQLAFNTEKGNCLACHLLDDGQTGGDLGPPILYMQGRFADKSELRNVISDARAQNPDTVMPPYGPHGILSPEEIEAVTEYIYSL
jgi:L-cysteine S-thiosulfotransferase